MRAKLFAPLKRLYLKYKTLVDYAFFGALTTLVNYAVYFALTRPLHVHFMAANVAAWVAAVAFAFCVNKRYVFRSRETGLRPVLKELSLFVLARLTSLGIESGLLYLLVALAGLNDAAVKITVGVLVVLTNYVFSKLVVFKQKAR